MISFIFFPVEGSGLFFYLSEKSPILICCHYWMELLIAGGERKQERLSSATRSPPACSRNSIYESLK